VQSDGSTVLLEPGRWKARGERVVLVVDPVEAAIILDRVYKPYVFEDLGIHAIADGLNAAGIPAPSSLRRRGIAVWSKGTVWSILRNAVYRGRLVYGKAKYREIGRKRGKARRSKNELVVAEGAAPVIVPIDVWEAAQAKHGTKKFASGVRGTGLICFPVSSSAPTVGRSFRAKRQQRGRIPAYYLCGGYVAAGATVCDSPRIPMTYLDDAAISGIRKRLNQALDPDEIRRRLRGVLVQEAVLPDAVPGLRGRLRETERKSIAY
jgi:hypothetical protein